MNCPNVSIVILNWNGWRDTIECLESLYGIKYINYKVIIVDNGSEDDSLDRIRDYCDGKIEVASSFVKAKIDKPLKFVVYSREDVEKSNINDDKAKDFGLKNPLVIIKNPDNSGFPEGCNIGMRYALNLDTDYILLLNNDTCVDPLFLTELINVAESDPLIGILGSKIYYYYNQNRIQAAGGMINWGLGQIKPYSGDDIGQFDEIMERDFVYGTSFLIKKSVLKEISLMNPFYFFGVEEYDYCTRAKHAGFKIIYVPRSRVWHKAGASSSKLTNHPKTLQFIKNSSGQDYYKYYYQLFKTYGPSYFYPVSFILFYLNKEVRYGLHLLKNTFRKH